MLRAVPRVIHRSRFSFPASYSVRGFALKPENKYDWVDKEAEKIIAANYNRHHALADKSTIVGPALDRAMLEKLGAPAHYKPKNFGDYSALFTMKFLRIFTHLFFREKYHHHALVLETVAAVPGIVGGMWRHLRSLRRMERDHGWIHPLLEEAENERMHLLIWMKVTQPTRLERAVVIMAQAIYFTWYSLAYALSPRVAHRMVGYLEEEAHSAYTEYLGAVDSGALPNLPAPDIAKKYYHLPDDATLRDVILHVRGDECMHRDMNHMFALKYENGEQDTEPHFFGQDVREEENTNRA